MIRQTILPVLILVLLILAGCLRDNGRENGQETDTLSPGETGQVQALEPTLSGDMEADLAEARQVMVERTIQARGVSDPEVIEAMLAVPRHRYVRPEDLDQAYDDHPLPIGYGQTISQPYIVAWMTELLELEPGEKVLEIGTGSGYQAAVLAELEDIDVYTIEIVPELAEIASSRLAEMADDEVNTTAGDGYYGWPDQAPFDAIIVTAAPDHLPAPLAEQLAEGGRLVIPIGPPGGYQSLWKFVKTNGELQAYNLGGVSFVPFTGEGVTSGEAGPTTAP